MHGSGMQHIKSPEQIFYHQMQNKWSHCPQQWWRKQPYCKQYKYSLRPHMLSIPTHHCALPREDHEHETAHPVWASLITWGSDRLTIWRIFAAVVIRGCSLSSIGMPNRTWLTICHALSGLKSEKGPKHDSVDESTDARSRHNSCTLDHQKDGKQDDT